MLEFAGFVPGSGILDAGCGSGSFLSLLQQGGARELVALDAAFEHVAALAEADLYQVKVRVQGSITALPFANGAIDGAWSANTLQFLDDRELGEAFDSLQRVVRPRGIVAIKDVDMSAFKIAPAPPFLGPHLAEACISGSDVAKESFGSLRGRDLRVLMQQAGFGNVRQKAVMIERWGPLSGYDAEFWREWLPYLANLAEMRGVPEADLDTWRTVATPDMADSFIGRRDFYGCELQVVCVGTVPDS